MHGKKVIWHLTAIAIYAAITCCWLWNVILHIGTTVTESLIDPVFNVWSVALSVHNVLRWKDGLPSLFYANIFYPAHNAAAYGDVFIGLLPLSLPLHLFISNNVALVNMLTILSFVLSAYLAYVLGYRLFHNYWAAFGVGLVFGFCPLRAAHVGHLTGLSTQWLLLGLLSGLAAWQSNRRRWWICAGLMFGLSAVTNLYYFAYLVPVALVSALLVYRSWSSTKLIGIAWASLVCTAFVLIFSIPYMSRHVHLGLDYGYMTSIDPLAYLSTSPYRFLDSLILPQVHFNGLHVPIGYFPGFVCIAILAIVIGMRWRKVTPLGVFCISFALGAFIVSLGPILNIKHLIHGIPLPLADFMIFVPSFRAFRSPDYAALGVYLMIALGTGYGISLIRKCLSSTPFELVLGPVIIFALIAESLYSSVHALPVPTIPHGEYWLAQQPSIHTVLELPDSFTSPRDWQQQTEIMYDSTVHWKNLINGQASISPPESYPVRLTLASYPSTSARQLVRKLHIDALVLRVHWMSHRNVARIESNCQTLYTDSVEVICRPI